MQGRLIAVAAIFVLFAFAVPGFQQAYFDAGIEGGASNTLTETVTVDEGNLTTLSKSNNPDFVYDDQSNITVEQGGNTFIAQGNWTWFQHNGTILWNDTTALTDGNNADVTYTFAEPTTEQELTKNVGSLFFADLVEEWAFIAGIVLVLGAAAIAAGRA